MAVAAQDELAGFPQKRQHQGQLHRRQVLHLVDDDEVVDRIGHGCDLRAPGVGHQVAVIQASLIEPGAVALEQAVCHLALGRVEQALPGAQRQVVGQRQRAAWLRADDAAELLEQRLRVQVAQQPQGLPVSVAPADEGWQAHLSARRHSQGLQQLAVAEEVNLLLRVLEAMRGVQRPGALRQVGGQGDVQHPAFGLTQPRQRDGRLARAGRADDHQRHRVPVGLLLGIVEDDGLVQQLKAQAFRPQPAQRRGLGLQARCRRICQRFKLDLGFIDHRAPQEARALIGMVLDDFQCQAHRLALAIAALLHPRKLQQQAVGVVQPGPVVRAGVQLLDVGRAEVIGLDGRLDLLEGWFDATEVETLVEQKAHAARR